MPIQLNNIKVYSIKSVLIAYSDDRFKLIFLEEHVLLYILIYQHLATITMKKSYKQASKYI